MSAVVHSVTMSGTVWHTGCWHCPKCGTLQRDSLTTKWYYEAGVRAWMHTVGWRPLCAKCAQREAVRDHKRWLRSIRKLIRNRERKHGKVEAIPPGGLEPV